MLVVLLICDRSRTLKKVLVVLVQVKKCSFPPCWLFTPLAYSLLSSLLGMSVPPVLHPAPLLLPNAAYRGLSEVLQRWRWCCFIKTWGQYWWPPLSVTPTETVVTHWRGFQPEGTSHDSFKSTQIKLFMAWKWPHRMGATKPPEKPNTIVMDITRHKQQRAEETSVDQEQNSSRLFREAGQGMLTGWWMVCLTLWKWMGAPWNKCILILCTHWDTKSTLSPGKGTRQKAWDENKIGKVGMCLRQIPSARLFYFLASTLLFWAQQSNDLSLDWALASISTELI